MMIGAGLAATAAGVSAFGAGHQSRERSKLHRLLESRRRPHAVTRYDAREIAGLPPVVQRYFHSVLKDGEPVIAAARIQQHGTVDLGDGKIRWLRFTARQHVVAQRAGLHWDARVALLPGIPVCVHDAYADGTGFLDASLFGAIGLAHLEGGAEIAHAELLRFLAEAVWYPTALLPSQGVIWEAVDERSAKATLGDGEHRATLLIRFDSSGLIASARAEGRARAVGKSTIPTPWEACARQYERRGGFLIPLEAEAAWLLPAGRRPYWRGRIDEVHYEYARER
jgi:hypothetical protein